MHILLLVAVLLPIVGCGAVEVSAGTVAATRVDVLTCQHDSDHHPACEQAARPIAVNGPGRPAPDHGHLPPAACPLATGTAPPDPCAGTGAPAGTGPIAPPGGALLMAIGVVRR